MNKKHIYGCLYWYLHSWRYAKTPASLRTFYTKFINFVQPFKLFHMFTNNSEPCWTFSVCKHPKIKSNRQGQSLPHDQICVWLSMPVINQYLMAIYLFLIWGPWKTIYKEGPVLHITIACWCNCVVAIFHLEILESFPVSLLLICEI
jgi:hypothetical protein